MIYERVNHYQIATNCVNGFEGNKQDNTMFIEGPKRGCFRWDG